jgi:hypothetical protein
MSPVHTELFIGRNVQVNSRVLVFMKGVDNHGTKLEDITSHSTATSTKTRSVSENHKWKTFLGEIADGLGCPVR